MWLISLSHMRSDPLVARAGNLDHLPALITAVFEPTLAFQHDVACGGMTLDVEGVSDLAERVALAREVSKASNRRRATSGSKRVGLASLSLSLIDVHRSGTRERRGFRFM